MTENEWDDFLEKEIIREIEKCWHEVYTASRRIVEDAKVFGFHYMEIASPNIHQILDSLRVIEFEMSLIWEKQIEGELNIDDTRLIHNIQQQILNMKQMATALARKDKSLYDEALRCISNQAPM